MTKLIIREGSYNDPIKLLPSRNDRNGQLERNSSQKLAPVLVDMEKVAAAKHSGYQCCKANVQ